MLQENGHLAMAVSFQCMTKSTTNLKKKKERKWTFGLNEKGEVYAARFTCGSIIFEDHTIFISLCCRELPSSPYAGLHQRRTLGD